MPRLLLCLAAGVLAHAQGPVQVPERPVSLLEALETTLEKNPNIQLSRAQLDIDRGALRVATGRFDRTYLLNLDQSYTNQPLTRLQQLQAQGAGVTASSQGTDLSTYGAGAQQLLRNGITVGPVAQVNRQTDNLTQIGGVSTSNISFQLIAPLLRGRGREVVTAQERSAQLSVDATVFELNQTIAQQLAATAGQYWNAVATGRDLVIARNSEERGIQYASVVQALIDADRIARIEINNVTANVAQRSANRVAAEQQLFQARQNLALAMGLTVLEITTFPLTTDAMPDWTAPDPPAVNPQLLQAFIDRALDRRADLLAAGERQRSTEALLPAARNQLRPQLDMSLSLGYQGLLEGKNYFRIFGSPFQNVGGPTAIAGLRYSFPPKNNVALGVLAQTEASAQQARVLRGNVSRTIASNVQTSMISVTEAVIRVRIAREAVNAAQRGLDGEREKFRLGINSVVDLLTVEDRLTTALRTENAAQLDYALAVVNLRYATGTLIDPRASAHTIDRNVFSTPPFDWGK
jgi:outer membrane protein TolC